MARSVGNIRPENVEIGEAEEVVYIIIEADINQSNISSIIDHCAEAGSSNPMTPISLDPAESKSITSTAPSDQATSFKLKVCGKKD